MGSSMFSGCSTNSLEPSTTERFIAKIATNITKTTLQSSTTPTSIVTDVERQETTEIPKSTATLDADAWQQMPVIPKLSERALQIYENGIKQGTNPNAFSKIGDCESRTTWFLSTFDGDPSMYSLGEYQDLQPVIDHYRGSWSRLSQAAKPGFTTAAVLSPLWADPEQCEKDETPLACEFRIHNPSVVLINMGTNDVPHKDRFEENLRAIAEYCISRGVLPILGTKADNLEGDNSINETIAKLAYEYDIPLWNFWLAVQPLPGHGLQPDGAHLTYAGSYFDRPGNLDNAWPMRNLTALQVLQVVIEKVDVK
jgi:hypothetical protein